MSACGIIKAQRIDVVLVLLLYSPFRLICVTGAGLFVPTSAANRYNNIAYVFTLPSVYNGRKAYNLHLRAAGKFYRSHTYFEASYFEYGSNPAHGTLAIWC